MILSNPSVSDGRKVKNKGSTKLPKVFGYLSRRNKESNLPGTAPLCWMSGKGKLCNAPMWNGKMSTSTNSIILAENLTQAFI
jgi:hypothetical protein